MELYVYERDVIERRVHQLREEEAEAIKAAQKAK